MSDQVTGSETGFDWTPATISSKKGDVMHLLNRISLEPRATLTARSRRREEAVGSRVRKCPPPYVGGYAGFTALALVAAWFVALPTTTLRAAEEVCATCDKTVRFSGDFSHRITESNAVPHDAKGRDIGFGEAISGPHFSVSVPDLEPGEYSVDIGVVESQFDEPDRRIFSVTCGTNLIATNLDIFTASGGKGKPYHIEATVEHAGDAASGPLTFSFTAFKGDATLSTFSLRTATGHRFIFTKASELFNTQNTAVLQSPEVTGPVLWKDPAQPLDTRIHDLIHRMSLAEKVSQMRNSAPAIPRLGVPAYNYWNECLHGVARAGVATVFPQAIGMAATWDQPLLHDVADAIATEARAKHNAYVRTNDGNSAQYYGLTFWTPNINIFRDPRWGRGQETYGEDPFLTGRMAVSFIEGLQGDNPKYLKAMACAKHFAVHSGPEPARHSFDATPPERDFYETYLPQFEAAVREAHVGTVMGAYNAVYGEPACSSRLLLTDLLRKQWGFQGHVVSDCGAINDIFSGHKTVPTAEEAAARAVKAGCDLCCGSDFNALARAVQQGLITEAQVDTALSRVLAARFELGLFDPPAIVPYAHIPIEKNNSQAHADLALRVACESIVLLKNDGLLPLDRTKVKRIAVIGPNADSALVLLGNYHGTPSDPITILQGIKSLVGDGVQVVYEKGCPAALRNDGENRPTPEMTAKAVAAAKSADVVIFAGGLDATLEREEKTIPFEGFEGGDRTRIELPEVQADLLKMLRDTGTPVVFVNCSGSAIAMPWEAKHLPAIVQAWYPGEAGGRAVAEVLFGDVNPAGRLPITFYRSTSDLPPFDAYSMADRTYRYFTGQPLFAFGHGLSYTRFKYSNARIEYPNSTNRSLRVTVNVKNIGPRDGDEVVQVYFRHVKSWFSQPRLALCGFRRIHVRRGEIQIATVDIPLNSFRYWDPVQRQYAVESGKYELLVGAASDDIREKLPLSIGGSE